MTYKLKYINQTAPKQLLNRQAVTYQGEEPLTGMIGDKPASDIEERFYRGCLTNNIKSKFQEEIPVATSLPGQEKQIDFILKDRQAVNVHGEIGHSSSSDKARDAVRNAYIDEALAKEGLPPIQTVYWYELNSQQQANETARRFV